MRSPARILLALLGVLLAVVLIWLQGRTDVAAPAVSEPDSARPATTAAVLDALPELEREESPAASAELLEYREYVASLPTGSLTVRVRDPYGLPLESCWIRLETRLPDSRRAGQAQGLDRDGTCRFENATAGRSWLSLIQQVEDQSVWPICEQSFDLLAGEHHEQVMDLAQRVAVVELDCRNAPVEDVESFRLGMDGSLRTRMSGSVLAGPPLRLVIPVNTTLSAAFTVRGTSWTTAREFREPGFHVWRIELPAGSLHVSHDSRDAADGFRLKTDPDQQEERSRFSILDGEGRHSFHLLPPGRYFLEQVNGRTDAVRNAAACVVEIHDEPVFLDLVARPTGTLSFHFPVPPETKHAGQVLSASVYPRGTHWPAFATGRFSKPDLCQITDLPEGDYDLVLEQASWSSRTPVTVRSGISAPCTLEAWRRQVNLTLGLLAPATELEPHTVQLLVADGSSRFLRFDGIQIGVNGRGWSYRTAAPPGPARLLVRRASGEQMDFDFVVADAADDQHAFELKD